jgi:hypothetical protein
MIAAEATSDEQNLVRLKLHRASGIGVIERDETVWWYRGEINI